MYPTGNGSLTKSIKATLLQLKLKLILFVRFHDLLNKSHKYEEIENKQKGERTCMAMRSGSKVVMRLVKSGQLFLTRRRKLLAFQVINFNGSFFSLLSSASESFSLGFFTDPSESFSTTLKNRFIFSFLFPLRSSLFALHSSLTLFASTGLILPQNTHTVAFFSHSHHTLL